MTNQNNHTKVESKSLLSARFRNSYVLVGIVSILLVNILIFCLVSSKASEPEKGSSQAFVVTGIEFHLQFSSDGKHLITFGEKGVRSWSFPGLEFTKDLGFSGNWFASVTALSPNEQVAITPEDGSLLNVRETNTGKNLYTLPTYTNLNGVKFNPDGSLFSTEGQDKLLGNTVSEASGEIRQVSDGKLVRKLDNRLVTFSPDGSLVATDAKYPDIAKLEQMNDNKLTKTLKQNSDNKILSALKMTFSPDSSLLAISVVTKQNAGLIQIWKVSDDSLLYTIPVRDGVVRALAFSPDGQTLAIGRSIYVDSSNLYKLDDYDIDLWSISTNSLIRRLNGHKNDILDLAFSPGGEYLVSSSKDDTLRLWQVKS